MIKLHYNYKDLFRCTRLGLSIKKMFVMLSAITLGAFAYTIFTYIAFIANGTSIKTIWETYKFIPVPVIGITTLTWYSWLIWIVGVCFLFYTIHLCSNGCYENNFRTIEGKRIL